MVDASIVITSYNHAPYIAQCLTSILAQTTKRNIEIVWYDDASTDDTVGIGEKILLNSKYDVIRVHSTNNRHQRKVPVFLDEIERCRGRYIFFMDCDDYWVSTNKIDLQIEALDSYPNVNLCFTPAYAVNGNNDEPTRVIARYSTERAIFTFDQVVAGDGGFMPTNSLCLRRDAFLSAPDWIFEKLPVVDYLIQVIGSFPLGALYLPEITCTYRENVENSWTTTIFNNDYERLDFEAGFIDMLVRLHKYYPGHRDSFEEIVMSHSSALLRLSIQQKKFLALQRATIALSQFN